MASKIRQAVQKALERDFLAGTVYRIDLDRVDVIPTGSSGTLRSIPLSGDRDKVKPGDPIKLITVAGERVAIAQDVALDLTIPDLTVDPSDVELAEALLKKGTGEGGGSGPGASGVTNGWDGWVYPNISLVDGVNWGGQARSTASAGLINFNTQFGVPSGAEAVYLYVAVRDSGSNGTAECNIRFDKSNPPTMALYCDCNGQYNDSWERDYLTVPINPDGTCYYWTAASGASTLDIFIWVIGYKMPTITPTTGTDTRGWVYLSGPLSAGAWTGTNWSTTARTNLNLVSTFNVPSGVRAVLVGTYIRDTASAAQTDLYLALGATDNASYPFICRCNGLANNAWATSEGIVPVDASGNIAYTVKASGASTMNVYLYVWGYLLGGDEGVASGWVFVEPTKAATWYGKATSSVATKTAMNFRSEFNVPAGATAVLMRVAIRDSGSTGNTGLYMGFWTTANSTDAVLVCRLGDAASGTYVETFGVVPIDASGNSYYTLTASGTNTMNVYPVVVGYLLPYAIEKANAATLQGYEPKANAADTHVILSDGYGNTPNLDWRVQGGAVYSSATQVSIPGNYVSYFPKGSKVRIKQTSYKYFYVTSSSYSSNNTYINLTGGSTYSVANAAIDELAFSHTQMPENFPEWFDYTPAWTAATTAPAIGNGTLAGRFKMDGSLCTLLLRMAASTTTTFGSGNWSFSLPVAVDSSTSFPYFGSARVRRPGTYNYLFAAQLANTDTVLQFFMPTQQGGVNVNNLSSAYPMTWTASLSDYLEVQIQYKF